MELKVFLAELVTSLARLDFVVSLELRTEVFTLKGRAHLMQRAFLEVYFKLSKNYERLPKSSEAMIYLSMTRLMLRRLTATKLFLCNVLGQYDAVARRIGIYKEALQTARIGLPRALFCTGTSGEEAPSVRQSPSQKCVVTKR
jgi:hypothetical protein